MWLSLNDPRLLLIVGELILLIAVLIRVRSQRQARRRRVEAELRRRHLAWVARQEQADGERSAAQAAETARAEQHAVAQQALHIADEIAGGLAHDDRARERSTDQAGSAPARAAAEAYSAHTGTLGRDTAEPAPGKGTRRARRLTDAELRRLVYSLITVDQEGWRRWQGSPDQKGYPRVWLSDVRKWTQAYRLVYRWEQGRIPTGWTIDHTCGLKDCMDHLECVTVAENVRRRHARERGELPIGHTGMVPPRRAV